MSSRWYLAVTEIDSSLSFVFMYMSFSSGFWSFGDYDRSWTWVSAFSFLLYLL
jgi:hypothetical protein